MPLKRVASGSAGEPKTVRQEQRERINYYFEVNWFASTLMGTGKWPILRFSLILLAWYPLVWLFCYWDNALSISGKIGKAPVGLFEDLFMFAIIPTFIWSAIALRRVIQKVDDFFALFPEMLKPKSPNRGDDMPKLVQSLANLRDTIALRNRTGRTLWRWLWISWMIVCVLLFQDVLPLCGIGDLGWATRPFSHPRLFVFATIWAVFLNSLIVNCLWYVLAIGFTTFPIVKRYADRDQLWIVPNAPDGQGGLSPLGAVAFGMTSVLGSAVVLVAVWIFVFGFNLAAFVGGGGWIILVTTAFFWPLWSTHDAMRRAKQAELKRVGLSFRREYELLPATAELTNCPVPVVENERLTARLDMMAKLEHLHAAVKSMPVWPFDVSTLRKYLLLIVIPLLSGLANRFGPAVSETVKSMLDASK
jgi:hypothetical protein